MLGTLISYLEMAESGHTPEQQRQRTQKAALAMIATLSQRARQQHRLRGWLVRFFLQRAHALSCFREMTRFVIGLRLAQARAHLWSDGNNPLTHREREVLAAALPGLSHAAIAAHLSLSEGTVRNHLSAAMQKLGAHNRMEAARLAEQKGWL